MHRENMDGTQKMGRMGRREGKLVVLCKTEKKMGGLFAGRTWTAGGSEGGIPGKSPDNRGERKSSMHSRQRTKKKKKKREETASQ